MITVYVAGSYNSDNIIKTLNNIHFGTKKCVELLKLGFVPFCPWLDFQFQFYDTSLTIEDYYRYSLGWLAKSDIVYVLPNFEKSNGTIAEIKKAKELGIPIVHSDKELFAFSENLRAENGI